MKNRIVGLVYVETDNLVDHPKNWRKHPEEQRALLGEVLEKVGIAGAALAYRSSQNPDKLTLVDGHLRTELIEGQHPVLELDITDAEAELLLASHDPIATMAVRDNVVYAGLMADLSTADVYSDILRALDPDIDIDALETDDGSSRKKAPPYPLVAAFDEGYDYVIIFARTDMEMNQVATALDLQRKEDRGKIGRSHVMTAEEFMERWRSRSSS